MNNYVKSIIIKEITDQIEEELFRCVDELPDDLSVENFKVALFAGPCLKNKIRSVLERFED